MWPQTLWHYKWTKSWVFAYRRLHLITTMMNIMKVQGMGRDTAWEPTVGLYQTLHLSGYVYTLIQSWSQPLCRGIVNSIPFLHVQVKTLKVRGVTVGWGREVIFIEEVGLEPRLGRWIRLGRERARGEFSLEWGGTAGPETWVGPKDTEETWHSICLISLSPHNSLIDPLPQRRKLRFREVKSLTQSTTSRKDSWCFNPGLTGLPNFCP